jgi:hypothetical protein
MRLTASFNNQFNKRYALSTGENKLSFSGRNMKKIPRTSKAKAVKPKGSQKDREESDDGPVLPTNV